MRQQPGRFRGGNNGRKRQQQCEREKVLIQTFGQLLFQSFTFVFFFFNFLTIFQLFKNNCNKYEQVEDHFNIIEQQLSLLRFSHTMLLTMMMIDDEDGDDDDDDDIYNGEVSVCMYVCMSRFCLFHFLPFLGTFGFRNKRKSF